MSEELPQLQGVLVEETKRRLLGGDSMSEIAIALEGEVFSLIWDAFPKGAPRDLLEEVLELVDWKRQAELATWEIEGPEDEEGDPYVLEISEETNNDYRRALRQAVEGGTNG